MIARVPVIAAKTNGIPEVVGDVGILIDPHNADDLAKKMIFSYHLSKTDLTQWGQKSYERVTNVFSIPRFKELFWDLPLVKQNNLC
jgi:glycosyltransferase involved in cell wall biosynthesis